MITKGNIIDMLLGSLMIIIAVVFHVWIIYSAILAFSLSGYLAWILMMLSFTWWSYFVAISCEIFLEEITGFISRRKTYKKELERLRESKTS